jgi:hypothetical protein
VAAISVGRHIKEVVAFHEFPGAGEVWFSQAAAFDPQMVFASGGHARSFWNQSLVDIRNDMRIALAGPVAEAKAFNTPMRSLGAKVDLDQAAKWAKRLDELWVLVSAVTNIPLVPGLTILQQERARTRRWISRPKVWRAVLKTAMVLSRKERLSAREFRLVVGWALEPPEQASFGLD